MKMLLHLDHDAVAEEWVAEYEAYVEWCEELDTEAPKDSEDDE